MIERPDLVPSRALSAREVADLLGLSVDTIKQIPARDLPYFRATDRGHRRYQRADVDAYVSRRRVDR